MPSASEALKALAIAALALAAPAACAAEPATESLCVAKETVVFSCHVGQRQVSLCKPAGATNALTYRYGRPGRLELVYPDRNAAEKGEFTRTSALRYGGEAVTVSFRRGGYEYRVYSS